MRKRLKGSHLRQVRGLHNRIDWLRDQIKCHRITISQWKGRAIRAEYRVKCLKSQLQVGNSITLPGLLIGVVIGQVIWHML